MAAGWIVMGVTNQRNLESRQGHTGKQRFIRQPWRADASPHQLRGGSRHRASVPKANISRGASTAVRSAEFGFVLQKSDCTCVDDRPRTVGSQGKYGPILQVSVDACESRSQFAEFATFECNADKLHWTLAQCMGVPTPLEPGA
jgi:hypothetical protein